MEKEEVYNKAAEILRTWDKEDLISDILELTSYDGLVEFVSEVEENA